MRQWFKPSIIARNGDWLSNFFTEHEFWVVVARAFEVRFHLVVNSFYSLARKRALHDWNFLLINFILSVPIPFLWHLTKQVLFHWIQLDANIPFMSPCSCFILCFSLLSFQKVLQKRIVTHLEVAWLILLQANVLWDPLNKLSCLWTSIWHTSSFVKCPSLGGERRPHVIGNREGLIFWC